MTDIRDEDVRAPERELGEDARNDARQAEARYVGERFCRQIRAAGDEVIRTQGGDGDFTVYDR